MLERPSKRAGARFTLVLLAVCIGACTQSSSSPGTDESRDAIEARLDRVVPDLMERHRIPGVAIAVVATDGLILTVAYGYTDQSRTKAIAATTIFEAASLGKPLYAYALLHRRGDAPLDLDARLAGYLDAPIAPEPESGEITVRQTLSHSSGLVFSDEEGRRSLAFPPGSQWQYSGLGFSVLQQAVAALWAEPLEETVSRAVTGPLGLASTSYLPPVPGSEAFAFGHDRQGNRLPRTEWPAPNAASSLHTSATDYGRFLSAMLADVIDGRDERFASMIEPQIEVDRSLGLSWGLGWAVARESNEQVFLHWGSNPGFKSLALGSVTRDLAVVVLTNGDNGLEMATELVPIVFGRDYSFLDFYMLHPDD